MGTTHKGRLLLVEDESVLRGLISQFLKCEGFDVAEAADGKEGIERFRGHGPFDVVLLDLNLPIYPGVEVCRRIKLERPDQPVVVCSAVILEGPLAALGAMGVTQFLSKPYHPAELLARIARARGAISETKVAAREPLAPEGPRRLNPARHAAGPHAPCSMSSRSINIIG